MTLSRLSFTNAFHPMSGRQVSVTILVLWMSMLSPSSVHGQQPSVSDALSSLLLAESGDPRAAAATHDTLSRLLLVELATQPTTTSASGFAYRFNADLGTLERTSQSFGAFYNERALRAGKGQASLGLTIRYADYSALQGISLDDGTFPANATRLAGATQPAQVDALRLSLHTRATTAFATYGVTDRLDIGASVSIIAIDVQGTRISQTQGPPSLRSSIATHASGFGDASMNMRYTLIEDGSAGLATGVDVYLPTGSAANLVGAGRAAARFLAIGSIEGARLATHVNLGYQAGGASKEFSYSAAFTVAAAPRATLVAEFLGRRVADLHSIEQVYAPSETGQGLETMRWLPTGNNVQQALLVTGAKWNIHGNYLLNTSLLFRLTNSGLTARVVPSISLDYTFQR